MAQEGHMLISMTTLMVGMGKKQLAPKMGSAIKGLPNNRCPSQRELEVERDRVGAVLSYR